MSKLLRLVDFQVGVGSANLRLDEQRTANLALFSTYEPVRLWLREREIKAPFRKIVVALSDQATFSRWHGNASNVAGICEVTEAVDVTTLLENARDHRWVLAVVDHALGCVRRSTGWHCDELESFINTSRERPFLLVHVFASLAKTDQASGMRWRALALDQAWRDSGGRFGATR